MNAEMIGLIIRWGPLAVVGLVFLIYFFAGLIKGSYKVTRRLVYVFIYVILAMFLVGPITDMVLDMNINISGTVGVRNFIVDFVENNEAINDFLKYSPELKDLIVNNPEIITNPILFIVLIVVVLPLSFPIYWIYVLIWNLFAKLVFKRQKYQKDGEGNILRNEKGKKLKVERKKHRLIGGLVNGVKGAVIFSSVLMPVNFVNRIYNEAKEEASLKEGETLCGSIEFAKLNEDICKYIDIYNKTLFAKMSGENSLDKLISDKLTTVKADGEKVSLEKEMSNLAVTFVLINDSGIIDLFINGGLNLDTLDLSVIDFDKVNAALDVLFSSGLLSKVIESGVNYVMNEILNDNLVDLLKDDDIISKISYENSNQIRDELKNVVNVFKYAVEEGVDNVIIDNRENAIGIVNNISEEDVRGLVNRLLSLRIISKAMPSALKAYAEEHGVNVPNAMTSELNNEIASQLVNAIKFVKTMEATKLEDITEGDIVDNLSNLLFVNGALKSNSKDSLATLLHDLNRSYLFKDVVSTQLNNLLKDKDYKIDARVLKYVDSKESWLKELTVLEKGFDIYKDYNETETVYYDKITGLLNEVSGTKVMISILPFAYDELLPNLGVEIDSEGFPEIEFGGENEDSTKAEFYEMWESELVVLKNVADALGDLKIQSMEDITVDLLEDDLKVEALSTVMGEVYKSDMLREPFVEIMKDTINDFVVDYGVEFTKEQLLSINTKDKWNNEFTNINSVLSIDFNDEENINADNLKTVFDAVDSMELFKTNKIEILKYAVKESNFLTVDEYNSISWPSSSDQEEIDAYWDNETSVLLKVVDKKETIETLTTSVELETMKTDEIGGLLDDVMKSNILKNIVADKMVTLFVDNGVKDDRDVGDSTVNLKNSILSVTSWENELTSIKEMVNISEENMNEVEDGEMKNSIEKMFDNIETSELLENTRATLLLKAVTTINIVDVPSDVTVDVLKNNNYEKYNEERDIIIDVSKNKDIFDSVGSMKLAEIDTDKVGSLLDSVTGSIIFKDYVVGEIKKVFVNNDVKDDRDVGESTTNLGNSIASVSDWGKELSIIQSMLTLEEDTFNNKTGDKTNIEIMFDNIETSALLQNTRANLLIKAVNTLNIEGVNTNYVTVDSLKATYNSVPYYLYNNEVDVFVLFAENKEKVDDLSKSDITSLTGANKTIMSAILNVMEQSLVVKDKYESTINSAVSSVKDKQELKDYGVTFKSANEARDVDWEKEIDILATIKNNIAVVKGYTLDDVVDDRTTTFATIGSTLDAVSGSAFLGEEEANNIANKVVTELTKSLPDPYKVTSISKNSGETWSDAFNRVVQVPNA